MAVATNHSDIGTMYLRCLPDHVFHRRRDGHGHSPNCSARPAARDPVFFNQMTTNHALIMIFGAVMPAFVGLPIDDPDADRRARHGVAA